ncbi:winged helix-turn-helix domain-containing protein [Ruminococcaceae bacterium OttesenSCG-928-A11]|nr:winged helix-turn-helix domain-containing protein [Ruminococcaceae bacterium OttesenSCG-928-A11]
MAKANSKKAAKEIKVRFFGNFQVILDGVIINESTSRAKRPWNLLQFLMVFRHKTVAKQQLIEALWPDDTSEQPDKALKNLVYRVRAFFTGQGAAFGQDVVLYRNGNYQLNNDLPWVIDFERFEALYNQAMREGAAADESIECAMEAIGLYRGDFLAEQVYEDWVLPYNTYYRTLFFKCVGHALDLLEECGRDSDIELVCNRALAVDQFEEGLHLAYMNALVRQDKKAAALSHYNKMADMFFREMGVSPSEELRELYQALSQSLNNTETDLYSIKNALSETEVTNDAFYCDFDVFRSLYRLEARAAERSGQAVFVGLLTLSRTDGGELAEGEELNRSMAALLDSVHQSLRRGDVVSRFSLSQYILMLPTLTVENAEMVLARVREKFGRAAPYKWLHLETKIQPLDPVM